MIDSYDFGRIRIDGKEYTSDVLVFPGEVRANWWRRSGHELCLEDLKEALKEGPKVLVVGTGYSGLMKVSEELREELRRRGIRILVMETKAACEKFNELLANGEKVVAALHLTC